MSLPQPVISSRSAIFHVPVSPPVRAPLGGCRLADLTQQARRDARLSARLIRDPVSAARSAGIALDAFELAALHEVGATVFTLSDHELERRIRQRRRQRTGETDAVAQVLIDYRVRVIDATRQALARGTASSAVLALLEHSLEEGAAWALMAPCLPVIDFPAAVAGAMGDPLDRALPISVAGFLYYLGISMVDDVIDHEIDERWGGAREEQVAMAGIALFAGLPMQAMRDSFNTDVTASRLYDCYQLFERASYQMSLGQYMDVSAEFSARTTMADCHEIIELKTGSTGELMAALAATMGCCTGDSIAALGQTCKSLYMAMQIASDIHDIWGKPISPDLGNGIVTLPTLYAYHASPPGDREVYKAKLASRDWTAAGHSAMRQYITAMGGLTFTILQAEATRQRAIAAWSELAGEKPGRQMFEYMFEAARVIG